MSLLIINHFFDYEVDALSLDSPLLCIVRKNEWVVYQRELTHTDVNSSVS